MGTGSRPAGQRGARGDHGPGQLGCQFEVTTHQHPEPEGVLAEDEVPQEEVPGQRPRTRQVDVRRQGALQRLADVVACRPGDRGGFVARDRAAVQRLERRPLGLRRPARGEDPVRYVVSGHSDGVALEPEDVLAQVVVEEGCQSRGEHGTARSRRGGERHGFSGGGGGGTPLHDWRRRTQRSLSPRSGADGGARRISTRGTRRSPSGTFGPRPCCGWRREASSLHPLSGRTEGTRRMPG